VGYGAGLDMILIGCWMTYTVETMVQCTVNISIISTSSSSVRYTYSIHGEFSSALHTQENKILLSNCFMQQQLMYSVMMD
jgi:hypothetical protein